jgi:hypothetical protein
MELSVRGIQDAGVQAITKHLIANEQEILRNPLSYPNGTLQYEAISSNVDDRTLREYCFILDLKVVVWILISLGRRIILVAIYQRCAYWCSVGDVLLPKTQWVICMPELEALE